jgi:hypothetical protein
LDWIGSVLFAVALVAVMIGLAEGSDWGWRSPRVIALLVCGVALLAGWSGQQLRAGNSAPLVELRLLRHPAVLAADTCAFLLIMAMYLPLASNSDTPPLSPVFVAGSPRTNRDTRMRSRWPTKASRSSSSSTAEVGHQTLRSQTAGLGTHAVSVGRAFLRVTHW